MVEGEGVEMGRVRVRVQPWIRFRMMLCHKLEIGFRFTLRVCMKVKLTVTDP